jgi:hypothetical protein
VPRSSRASEEEPIRSLPRKPAESPKRSFGNGWSAAVAYSRCMAEINMRTDNPKSWLMHGPGKDSPSKGWTAAARAAATPTPEAVNLLMEPQFQELLARLLLALAPYPEARRAAAAVLWNEEMPARQIEQIPLRVCDDEPGDADKNKKLEMP